MKFEFDCALQTAKYSLGWNHFIVVPQSVSNQLMPNHRRLICEINERVRFSCGLFPKGNGTYFITINKEIRKKLCDVNLENLNIILTPDQSKYGMPLPLVFKELLEQDLEGQNYFHQLTPGKQRNLIYLIGKPKSERLQLEKGFVVLDYLKQTKGVLDFKALNEAFKNNRFKPKE